MMEVKCLCCDQMKKKLFQLNTWIIKSSRDVSSAYILIQVDGSSLINLAYGKAVDESGSLRFLRQSYLNFPAKT